MAVYHCRERSKVHIWDSATHLIQDDWLDDAALEAKIPILSDLWSTEPDPSQNESRFILLSSEGDPANCDNPIHISSIMLNKLLHTSQVSPFVERTLPCFDLHMSHHLHYTADDKPSGLTIIIRSLNKSTATTIFIVRLRFADRACVCFLFASASPTLNKFQDICMRERQLLLHNPLRILIHLYEDRKAFYNRHQFDQVTKVREAETASGMVPKHWGVEVPSERLSRLRNLDEPNLLNHMYSSHTELCYVKNIVQWGMRYAKSCFEIVEIVEQCRKDCGLSRFMSASCRSDFEGSIRFTMGQWEQALDVVNEMLERIRGQINVVFSLIAQRDSKVSRQIAEDSKYIALLAAQDSKTMKTIAIVTLVFLPATLTTGIWSSNLFELPPSTNWQVFIGTTIGATILAFTIWFIFNQRPLPLPPSSRSPSTIPKSEEKPLFGHSYE